MSLKDKASIRYHQMNSKTNQLKCNLPSQLQTKISVEEQASVPSFKKSNTVTTNQDNIIVEKMRNDSLIVEIVNKKKLKLGGTDNLRNLEASLQVLNQRKKEVKLVTYVLKQLNQQMFDLLESKRTNIREIEITNLKQKIEKDNRESQMRKEIESEIDLVLSKAANILSNIKDGKSGMIRGQSMLPQLNPIENRGNRISSSAPKSSVINEEELFQNKIAQKFNKEIKINELHTEDYFSRIAEAKKTSEYIKEKIKTFRASTRYVSKAIQKNLSFELKSKKKVDNIESEKEHNQSEELLFTAKYIIGLGSLLSNSLFESLYLKISLLPYKLSLEETFTLWAIINYFYSRFNSIDLQREYSSHDVIDRDINLKQKSMIFQLIRSETQKWVNYINSIMIPKKSTDNIAKPGFLPNPVFLKLYNSVMSMIDVSLSLSASPIITVGKTKTALQFEDITLFRVLHSVFSNKSKYMFQLSRKPRKMNSDKAFTINMK